MSKKYRKTFLKQVLVRVDFQNTLNNYEKGLNPSVQKSINGTFPTLIEYKHKLRTILLDDKTGSTGLQSVDQILWTYYSKNKQKHTRIEPTDFYIQYDKYDSFHQLKRDFHLVFNSLIKSYAELNITRIGLRYIDEIDLGQEEDVFNWKQYLNPKLFSALSLPLKKDKEFISRAFSNLEFNFGDHNLTLKYGMINPDYPSTIKKKVFILDSDAYKRDNIQNEEVENILDQLHNKISTLFENRLIKEGLRKIMDGK